MKFYHISVKKWKVGDVISPTPFKDNLYDGVYVMPCSTPHYTLYQFGDRSLGKKRHYVYQVKPLRRHYKLIGGRMWDELIIKGSVEVMACLGEASKNGSTSMIKFDKKNKPLIKKKSKKKLG